MEQKDEGREKVEKTGSVSSSWGLDNHGLSNLKAEHWNPSVAALYEHGLRRGEGVLALGGGFVTETGEYTGRSPKDKYIVRDDTTSIVGKDEQESRALIEALADHIVSPQFVYQHRWAVGDVVVWDNCTVHHRAVQDYDLPQRRLLWRTTVKGDVPV